MEPLLLVLSAIVGWGGGGLVNWSADLLPGMGSDDTAEGAVQPGWRQAWAPFRSAPNRRHPLMLIVSVVLSVLMAWHWGWGLPLVVGWLYGFFLLTVIVIDLEHHLVLNMMLAPAAVVAVILSVLPWTPDALSNLVNALLGGAVGFGVFFLLAIIGRGALGMGDVKLAGVIGLMTGYPDVLWALIIGALVGAGVAIILLISRKATRKSAIAYAPYLAFGAFAVLWVRL
jgi:prepilin signal peptidase PulO-like enzyme (type II secretory pathway)